MTGFTDAPSAAFAGHVMPQPLTEERGGGYPVLTQSIDPDPETAAAAPVLSTTTVDELDSIATVLVSRFPESRLADVREVVYEAYRRIASSARITAHLIPLTMNRARTMMMTKEQEHGAS